MTIGSMLLKVLIIYRNTVYRFYLDSFLKKKDLIPINSFLCINLKPGDTFSFLTVQLKLLTKEIL